MIEHQLPALAIGKHN